ATSCGMVVRPLTKTLREHTTPVNRLRHRLETPPLPRPGGGGPQHGSDAGIRGLLGPSDVLRGDLVDHPHLARPTVWVAILPEILLGEAVDVRVPAVLRDLRHTPPDADVAIRIPRVDDRQRHGRVPAHVPVFYPPLG